MRATEFLTHNTVNEVAMNPGTFSAAIAQGQQQGVLVGFEFEVLVPAATLSKKNKAITQRTIQDIFDRDDYWTSLNINVSSDNPGVTVEQFNSLFKLKPNVKTKHSSIQAALDKLTGDRVELIKQVFFQVPEDIRIKVVRSAKNLMGADNFNDNVFNQIKFGKIFGRELIEYLRKQSQQSRSRLSTQSSLYRLAERIKWSSVPDWDDVLIEYLQPSFNNDDFSRFFNYDPQQVYTSLDLDDYDDSNYEDHDYDYPRSAKVLKPAVKNAFGRQVHVFSEYHERSKNLNDWYIEPDGSLQVDNGGDGGAEIVSPPMPAAEAMTVLKNFYGLANQLNLYTNSTTGLHINVSIPGNLDILKLAVFLGDQYILQQFGRQDSSYAKSAEKKIKAGAQQGPTSKNNVLNRKELERLAREATGGHTASISNNGDYISFRHVGGNYLKDYAKIANTAGRFIRAMIIASTPSAYAKEYQTKLAKLQSSNGPIESDLINLLRVKGTPVLNLSMWIKGRAQVSTLMRSLNLQNYIATTTQPNSEAAKNAIASNMQDGDRKAAAAAAPVAQFVTVIAAPRNAPGLQNALLPRNSKVQALYSGSGISGYAVVNQDNLQPIDPYTQTLLKGLLRQRLQPVTETP
jgi:hypothetical protein